MVYKQGVSKSFSVHGILYVYYHYYVFFVVTFMAYIQSFFLFLFSWHDRLSVHFVFDI